MTAACVPPSGYDNRRSRPEEASFDADVERHPDPSIDVVGPLAGHGFIGWNDVQQLVDAAQEIQLAGDDWVARDSDDRTARSVGGNRLRRAARVGQSYDGRGQAVD
jgi:hypothetical protein